MFRIYVSIEFELPHIGIQNEVWYHLFLKVKNLPNFPIFTMCGYVDCAKRKKSYNFGFFCLHEKAALDESNEHSYVELLIFMPVRPAR